MQRGKPNNDEHGPSASKQYQGNWGITLQELLATMGRRPAQRKVKRSANGKKEQGSQLWPLAARHNHRV
jgi:hypothetical protein